MKKFFAMLVIIVLAITLIGCGGSKDDTTPETPNNDNVGAVVDTQNETTPQETQQTTETDQQQQTVVLDGDRTIVSLAPAITATLIDLGFADSIIVADTNSMIFATDLPSDVIYMDMMAPDIETLIMLAPHIILASTITNMDGQTDPFAALVASGLPTYISFIPAPENINQIRADIRYISGVLGTDKGDVMIVQFDKHLDFIIAVAQSFPAFGTKTVYFEISPAPWLYSFGSGVFMNEMLRTVGATNIFANETGWLNITEESVIMANPDVIFTNVDFMDDAVGELLERDNWGAITAIQNGDVYYIDAFASSNPNHRVVIALEQMLEALYGWVE
jgi:iron complex transport system substrate-binding protein